MGLSWGDLNPASWPGQVKRRLGHDFGFLGAESDSAKQQRGDLKNQADQADSMRQFATDSFGSLTTEAGALREALRRRASGEDSLSAEQLRQGLGQQLAMQQSMAASASPANAPMAARSAMMNANRAATGMAGNQAIAGIQERAAAERALQDAILGQRAQDVQASLGAGQNAIAATTGQKPEGSWLDKYGGAIASGIGYATGGGGGGAAAAGKPMSAPAPNVGPPSGGGTFLGRTMTPGAYGGSVQGAPMIARPPAQDLLHEALRRRVAPQAFAGSRK